MARSPLYLSTVSGSEDTKWAGSPSPGSTWTRSFSAGDVVGMIKSPHMRRRPFDHRGVAEELLSPKSQDPQVFASTTPQHVDPGSRIKHTRYRERRMSQEGGRMSDGDISHVSYAFSEGGSPLNTGQSPKSPLSPGGMSRSMSCISPQSTRGQRSLSRKKPPNEPEVKPEDRALDFWPLGEGMRIMHHIEPKKHRAIALTGELYQGFPRNDWSDISHIMNQRGRYPAGRDQQMASQGPFPQGPSQEELRRNRNYDRSHGSMPLAHGMMRVGSQVMFL